MKSTTGYEIAERIYKLIDNRGVTVKQFERDAGLSNGYMRKLMVQKSTPSADRLQRIADYFGITTDFLLGAEAAGKKKSKGVIIKLVGRVAAGIPIEASENVIGEEEITQKLASTGEFFALLIKGDSMSPYILNGDKVIVKKQEDATTGDIVIALINGSDGVCKELKKTTTGIMLISKNPNYDPLVFTHADIDEQPVAILGKVVEIRREL